MRGQEFGEFIENTYGIGSDAWDLAAGVSRDDKGNILHMTNAKEYKDADGNASYRYNNTDWQDEIYRTAVSHDHNITVSGGLKNMPYRISLGYTNQDGILKTSNFERYTASVNVSPKFFDDHLTVNLNAKGMIANNRYADGGAIGAAVYMIPTFSVYDSSEIFSKYFGCLLYTSPSPRD